jgi:hypothetical protein
MTLRTLFQRNEGAESQPAPPLPSEARRAPALISAELDAARESIDPLAAKLSTAEGELSAAQREYDAGIEAYALGQRSTEPGRGELQSGIVKADALRRVHAAARTSVIRLSTELAAAELAEAIAAGRERLPEITALAEARAVEFEQALSALKKVESELFTLLFGRQTAGMSQRFASSALDNEAKRSRSSIARRVIDAAERTGYSCNPRFRTDGEVFLGEAIPAFFRSLAS